MSTMISFIDNSLENSFLTENDLRISCPLAFMTEPTNPEVSERYVQATTIDVVRDMEKLGWYPVQAKQCRPKRGSKGIRSFHMIALQNPNIKIQKTTTDANGNIIKIVDAYPRIILTNSHDGFNSFKFVMGLIRLICSNGLVLCSDEFANLSIRHINYTFETLKETINEIVERIPYVINTMNEMKNVNLNEQEKRELASAVVRIRKGVKDNENIEIHDDTINDILTPIRNEDIGDDLWSIFNVCQEKMIKGGFSAINNNKTRKQKGITSIKKDIECNQKLWETAMSFLKAA